MAIAVAGPYLGKGRGIKQLGGRLCPLQRYFSGFFVRKSSELQTFVVKAVQVDA